MEDTTAFKENTHTQEQGGGTIHFNEVTKIYPPDTVALDNVDLEIAKGEFVSIVGKSGAGKTTLLKLLFAEEAPTEGSVFFAGYDVHELKGNDLPFHRRKIGTVFQDYRLLPSATVAENVAYVMEVMGAPDDIIKRDVKEVLE